MKTQLIENLRLLAINSKNCPYLSMQTHIPGKVILNCGKYITQDGIDDLLSEFGNHAGLSYRISINTQNNLIIEILVKK